MSACASSKISWTLTGRQFEALKVAEAKGGAFYVSGSNAGGAIRRMCERLAEYGFVENQPPFPITQKGRDAIAQVEARAA